jgi:CBS domain-containing protein
MSTRDRHIVRADEVMTRDPMVVHLEDAAEPLLALFTGQDFNAVPVVDPEGHLLGMVTKVSLLRLFRGGMAPGTTGSASSSSLRVRDVMDTRHVWVEPADDLNVVVRQMTRYHVPSVPVVERAGKRHRVVGMVSRGDLLRGVAARPPTSA